MADVTVFKDASITVSVIDGQPPVDQTALVATLTAQVNALTSQVSALTSQNQLLASKIAAAQAALA